MQVKNHPRKCNLLFILYYNMIYVCIWSGVHLYTSFRSALVLESVLLVTQGRPKFQNWEVSGCLFNSHLTEFRLAYRYMVDTLKLVSIEGPIYRELHRLYFAWYHINADFSLRCSFLIISTLLHRKILLRHSQSKWSESIFAIFYLFQKLYTDKQILKFGATS